MNINRVIICAGIVCMMSCNTMNKVPADLSQAVLIPKPVSVQTGEGYFELNSSTPVYISEESEPLRSVAALFAEKLKSTFNSDTKIMTGDPTSLSGNYILLGISEETGDLGTEGYDLVFEKNHCKLTANTVEGVWRGIQTLLQILPDEFGKRGNEKSSYAIGGGAIRDYPSYEYRGAMLDVSRHFFKVEDVKRFIDLISFYKMNALHLHLSDDQGWRIEIKSWPNLTTHGGSTEVGGGEGGYYTQEQYKDIVKYAQDRFVTIVPEIDMPGHTNAALASYAELNCNNKATALYTKTEVGFSTLCVRKDITYQFVDDVVRELAEITPGPYIHLGGDESHVTKKEDFIYFINRIQSIPKKYGKQMVGWEEITQASLDSSTIVQHWDNVEHAKEGVKKGAKIIMSPARKVYLDMKYDSTTKLGLQWAGRIEVDSAYSWTISKQLEGIPRENILGVEAPLWTETVTNMDELEYLVFPRLPGIAEVGWSPESGRSWEEYKLRLAKHGSRMKSMDIDFYESKLVQWEGAAKNVDEQKK